MIQKAAMLFAGVVGFQPAAAVGPAPAAAPPAVTVRQVLTTQALVGETVVVSGRCIATDTPTIAKGSRPLAARPWQIEDNGEAAWVIGPIPQDCASHAVVITARVAQDSLPRLSPTRMVRQYLVVR
ncbi:MAG: hypothetical protein ABI742_11640 [Gemmatimonadota bacterium]